MIKPLLIGQAPGPNTDPDLPLYPVPNRCTGGRLAKIMGLSRGKYIRTFDRMNLLPRFPGQTGKEDKFPMAAAKLAAAVIRPLLSGRTVILVGRNVANAFGLFRPLRFHMWFDHAVKRRCLIAKDPHEALMAVIPHPSGRNHWYNAPGNLKEAEDFWAEFLILR